MIKKPEIIGKIKINENISKEKFNEIFIFGFKENMAVFYSRYINNNKEKEEEEEKDDEEVKEEKKKEKKKNTTEIGEIDIKDLIEAQKNEDEMITTNKKTKRDNNDKFDKNNIY